MVTSVVLYEGKSRETLRPILATTDGTIVRAFRRLMRERIGPRDPLGVNRSVDILERREAE